MSNARFIRKNWFFIGLLASVFFGVALPGLGKTINPGGYTTKIIIVVLFLITGYTLPSEQIKSGMKNYRLHLFLQLFIFGVIPLYFFLTARFFSAYLGGNIVVGLYALAVLPTTISTCVVFTQTSGGNVIGAIFNSSLANVAGIFISPVLLSLFLRGTEASLPLEEILPILQSLVVTILLPVLTGHYFRRRSLATANRVRKSLSEGSSALILLIVFITISTTAANRDFLGMLSQLAVPFAFLAASHILFIFAAYKAASLLKFSMEDRVCAMYVGPQKTIAMGVPLLSVYFASQPELLALALFPLLFYHPFQLMVAGILRGLLNREGKAARQAA